MDLVQPRPAFTFHDRDWPIYSRPRYLPGARLSGCNFRRVLLGDGSRVLDSDVEDAVIGLRSELNGCSIRRTLIMGVDSYYPDVPGAPPVGIGEGSEISNAIIDKNARIGRDVRIVQQLALDLANRGHPVRPRGVHGGEAGVADLHGEVGEGDDDADRADDLTDRSPILDRQA